MTSARTGGGDELSEALRRHGVAEAAIPAIRRQGNRLSAITRRKGLEFGATLDADTGIRLGEVIRGEVSRIDLGAHVSAMQRDRGYVMLHTHPADESFSSHDAIVLVLQPQVRVSGAIGADGTWYLLGRVAGASPAAPAAIIAAFDAEYRALRGKYRACLRLHPLTADELVPELSHELWTNIAPRLGLRYDRVVSRRRQS